jgi:YYY domain-containing protein
MRWLSVFAMEYGLVAGWLVASLALGLAGLPLAARLFQQFPDHGTAFALPLSLAVVGLVAYWTAYISLTLGLVIGLLVLVSLSAFSIRGLDRTEFDVHRMINPAIVFVLAFSFLVTVRAVDPGVHPSGGEKFLDFGLLKSLLRTSRLPPEDFWFASEPVQYYYGGHLVVALLAKLTFTEARYAYNLALAGFFGMLVTAAYGLAGAIAAERNRSARTAGVIAAFFVGFASNLETPARALLWALPDRAAQSVADWFGVEIKGLAVSPAAFNYWDASRVIPGTVNEFPLFAWLNGDLHAHMMSTPFLLLVVALCFAYYRTPADALRRRRALIFGAMPLVTGILVVINTWSFPTAIGVGWLTLTFANENPATLFPRPIATQFPSDGQLSIRQEVMQTASAFAVAVVVLVMGMSWSLPFWFGAASGRAIGFLPDRSALGPLVLVYGGFLLVFVPYLLNYARSLGTQIREAILAAMVGLVAVAWLFDAAALAVFGPLLLVGWLVLAVRRNLEHPSDSAESIVVRGRQFTKSDSGGAETGVSPSVPAVGFETLLLVAGVGLILLVEFVYVRNNAAPGRFNTVFKTYAQVWILFGTAAGVIGAWVVDAHRQWSSSDTLARHWRIAGYGLLTLVVILTAMYGALALTDHFTNEGGVKQVGNPTLDALEFVSTMHPTEAEAIRWLDNRTGQPNMVSVPGCGCNENEELWPYHWVNAPSSLTGIPTVAGWDHAGDYHSREAYFERVEDIETIYGGTPEQRARLLKKYNVRYIYVGPNERTAYDVAEFGKLRGVNVTVRLETVTIYRVNRNQLPA